MNGVIEIEKDDRIKVDVVNKEQGISYKVYKISSGRLYTDRVHDTAVLLDNKIIKGPSFQIRGGFESDIFNSEAKKNIVFDKGTPRKLRNLNGSVLSLLTGGAGNNNYWHWIFDVLPRFGICSKVTDINKIDYFLLPSQLERFQTETLDSLKIQNQKRISSEKFRHIKANELIVTDHPIMISGNATKDILNIPTWVISWLKNTFSKKNKTNHEKIKIYIDRGGNQTKKTPQRILINENEIKNYLIKENFLIVKLHELSFVEQIKMFQNAECIVGLHGGGFANIVFCQDNTKIIELKSLSSGAAIKNLAQKNNLNYLPIEVPSKQIYEFGIQNQQGSIEIPINKLKRLVEN